MYWIFVNRLLKLKLKYNFMLWEFILNHMVYENVYESHLEIRTIGSGEGYAIWFNFVIIKTRRVEQWKLRECDKEERDIFSSHTSHPMYEIINVRYCTSLTIYETLYFHSVDKMLIANCSSQSNCKASHAASSWGVTCRSIRAQSHSLLRRFVSTFCGALLSLFWVCNF